MKLWISKSSEVPIQEQLNTQIVLGIVSADLEPGECLPSTTEIARRFHIHANTVRAVYRALARRGWLEWRPGSGFYVRAQGTQNIMASSQDLDLLISTFLDTARSRGHSMADVQSRMDRWFGLGKPDRVVVIEPEVELREILVAEVGDAISIPVVGIDVDACKQPENLAGGFFVALYDHAEEVRAALPPELSCLFLRSRSVPKRLAGESKPSPDALVSVVSRWPAFLYWARVTLVAVGVDPSSLDLRDARQKGWDRGLTGQSYIITDSLLSRALPKACRPRVFQLIADESIAELRGRL